MGIRQHLEMSSTTFISAFAAALLVIGVVFVALSSDTTNVNSSVSSTNQLPSGTNQQLMASTELFRNNVEYIQARSAGHISGMGKCSASQTRKINDGIAAAAPYIQKAIEDPNMEYFTKWFGASSSRQPDSDVFGRMRDALKKMTDHDWTSDCCAASGPTDGHCAKTCKGSVMAYVAAFRDGNNERQYNNINFCSRVFANSAIQVGFTIFHESIHMVSAARDGNGNYGKAALVKLADNDPNKARLTANEYMLYAMQASMDYLQYEQVSTIAGHSVSTDGKCSNKYHNCVDLVQNGNCATGTVTGDQPLRGACCVACRNLQPPGFVACANKYTNCDSLGNSASECASGTLTSGEVTGTACCKTCKKY